MPSQVNKLRARTQNLILGSVTGTVVGFNLRFLFQRMGATDLVWIMFFVLGPAIGYLSGKEREKFENLRQEKTALIENLDKIKETLRKSTQKYKLLVEQANEAIFLTTAQGKILLYNQALSLLTGYSKEKLKNMNMAQLTAHEKNAITERKLWLDNGFSRSEERWKKKDGTCVLMDVSSKWIRVANHQLVLHVARNIQKRSEAQKQRYIKEMMDLAQLQVGEEAKRLKAILGTLLNPINKTVRRLSAFRDKYTEDAAEFDKMGAMWQNAAQTFAHLSDKVQRDLFQSANSWDLNTIVLQELYYLNFLFDDKNLVVNTSLAKELPMVRGTGSDFSAVVGSLLKAAIRAGSQSKKGRVSVSTRTFDNQVTAEIGLSGTNGFYKQLNAIFDPLSVINPVQSEEGGGMVVCREIGRGFDVRIDAGIKDDKSFSVRIHVPAARKYQAMSEEQEQRINNKESGTSHGGEVII